ncbi:hypothetical protein BKA67DRAFT_536584 [Truncatella angustata]|uniref:Uncharacterized protein n=1 Tax=Truncatella angustata TaxID=152316 RepID=A0A9P8UIL5_9PEZI|nr:uncharacterized protein BKA67DRAFT_536584 [Truncatella angustata]KAH6652872.1 hypothetical protein BKA67DRAFT_536584 [Truncatella angustata]
MSSQSQNTPNLKTQNAPHVLERDAPCQHVRPRRQSHSQHGNASQPQVVKDHLAVAALVRPYELVAPDHEDGVHEDVLVQDGGDGQDCGLNLRVMLHEGVFEGRQEEDAHDHGSLAVSSPGLFLQGLACQAHRDGCSGSAQENVLEHGEEDLVELHGVDRRRDADILRHDTTGGSAATSRLGRLVCHSDG